LRQSIFVALATGEINRRYATIGKMINDPGLEKPG
jgi:hypothetical protein